MESNPTMKWCPFPGCARAVKVPKFEKVNEEIMAISFSTPPSLSHSVDCGNGHYFCWYGISSTMYVFTLKYYYVLLCMLNYIVFGNVLHEMYSFLFRNLP